MEREEKRCIVCSTHREEGIVIWNSFICHHCEQEMIHTDVFDAKYPFFIEKMKSIWKMEA